MNDRQLELTMEELINGDHERCLTCKKPFRVSEGKFERLRTLDGRYVCSASCGSAPFLTPRNYSNC